MRTAILSAEPESNPIHVETRRRNSRMQMHPDFLAIFQGTSAIFPFFFFLRGFPRSLLVSCGTQLSTVLRSVSRIFLVIAW